MQSRLSSAAETAIGLLIGMVITLLASPVIYPLFGHSFTFSQNFGIMLIFTVLSFVRVYCLRRLFNWLHSKTSE